MSDFISREDIVNGVSDLFWNSTRDYEPHEIILALHDMIADIPAADVRPVVLCKDCRWYQIDELKKDGTEDRRYKPSFCVLALQRRDPNHFCADGKKREES